MIVKSTPDRETVASGRETCIVDSTFSFSDANLLLSFVVGDFYVNVEKLTIIHQMVKADGLLHPTHQFKNLPVVIPSNSTIFVIHIPFFLQTFLCSGHFAC